MLYGSLRVHVRDNGRFRLVGRTPEIPVVATLSELVKHYGEDACVSAILKATTDAAMKAVRDAAGEAIDTQAAAKRFGELAPVVMSGAATPAQKLEFAKIARMMAGSSGRTRITELQRAQAEARGETLSEDDTPDDDSAE